MDRRSLLFFLLPLLLTLLTARLLADTDNAATLYREAATITRELTPEEKTELCTLLGKKSASPPNPFPEERAEALLSAFAEPLALVSQAAALPHCDWQHDYETNIVDSPTFFPLLDLQRLLLLRAQLHFSQNNIQGAMENLQTARNFSNHVCAPTGSLFELVARTQMQTAWVNTVRINLTGADLTPTALSQLDQLATFPQSNWSKTLTAITLSEQENASIVEQTFKETPSWNVPQRVLNNRILRNAKRNAKKSQERLSSILAQSPHLALPELDRRQQVEAQEKPSDTLPNLTRVPFGRDTASSILKSDIGLALIRAAIALKLEDPQALEKHHDPYNGQPFTHTENKTEHTLTSALVEKGKPVSITISKTPPSIR